MSVSAVYLLWAPFGAAFPDRLVTNVLEYSAGIDHEFVVAACGHESKEQLDAALEPLSRIEHRLEVFDGPRIDLRTYREAVDRLPEHDEFVFMNSYTRPLASDWLAYLIAALREPGVGVVGPGGSYESIVTNMPWPIGYKHIRQFAPFPNPHVRTSCFALTRKSIGLLEWPDVQTKMDAWRFEAGRSSVTRQLQKRGLRPLVVGHDGSKYEIEEWPASKTFRAGEQENLLIADRRSDDYALADAVERDRLAHYAWGKLRD